MRPFSFILLMAFPLVVNAQTQLRNAGFEDWDNLGTNNEEPANWNGLMSADLCFLCSFGASQRIYRDKDEKVEGRFSARVESKSIVGGLVVNGTVTTGRVIAPGPDPSGGYNMTVARNPKFNQSFSHVPDSLIFWAKYSVSDESDSALVSFFIHGSEELKDPDHRYQSQKVVTKVQETFQTDGKWKRISLAFSGVNQTISPEYVLATFSSSYKAGRGNGDAVLWVDAIEFKYMNNQLTSLSK